MSHIHVEDIAFVRFGAPDLEAMATFVRDFGLECGSPSQGRLYARGWGPSPFLHVTELGDPGFLALGLRAASLDDLARLADATGCPLEDLDAPGCGKVVQLRDPDGHLIEVVAGQSLVQPSAVQVQEPRNDAGHKPRLRRPVQLAPGPSHVQRIGHCVLGVSDFRKSETWYKSHFGFLTSDELELAPGAAIGAFLRCNRGETPSDHHTLALMQLPTGPGFVHAAFEVADFDDLMLGHTHLLETGRYSHVRGIGRHILGSQIFDYWQDPWGHEVEHWTDGDLFTVEDEPNVASLKDLFGTQWGKPVFAS